MAYSCVDIGDNLNTREVTIKSKFETYTQNVAMAVWHASIRQTNGESISC